MSEPFFSLDALTSLPTIDDAKDMLFDHRVELLMRESLEEWLKFFKDKPKLGMGYLVNEIGRISEIFKRRNLVVHNGGRAGRRYFKEVEESLRPGVNLGEIVEVSTGYLKASIDLIEHQFLLLPNSPLGEVRRPSGGGCLLALVQLFDRLQNYLVMRPRSFGMFPNVWLTRLLKIPASR
jgi:hypothetical protein